MSATLLHRYYFKDPSLFLQEKSKSLTLTGRVKSSFISQTYSTVLIIPKVGDFVTCTFWKVEVV